jgi:hypothetical protein
LAVIKGLANEPIMNIAGFGLLCETGNTEGQASEASEAEVDAEWGKAELPVKILVRCLVFKTS